MTTAKTNEPPKRIKILLTGILSFVANYGTNVLLAKLLTTAEFGDIQVGLRTFKIAAAVISMGTATATMHFFSHYIRNKNMDNATAYRGWLFRTILRNSIIVSSCAALLIIAFTMHPDFLIFKNLDKLHIATWFVLIAPVGAAMAVFAKLLVSENKAVISQFTSRILKYITLLSCLGLTLFFFKEGTSTAEITALYFFVFVTLALTSFAVERLHDPTRNWLNKKVFDKNLPKQWQTQAHQAFSSGILLAVMSSMSMLILEAMPHAHEHEVSHYSAAMTICGVLNIIPLTFNLIFPNVSSAVANADGLRLLNANLAKVMRTNLLVTLITAVLLCAFGKTLLATFGNEYISAYPSLLLLMIDSITYNLFYFSSNSLRIAGFTQDALRITVIWFAVLLTLSLALTAKFDIYGNISAQIIAWLGFGLSNYITLRRKTNIDGLNIFNQSNR